jgi:phytanoyl-CoA hydroxylase
LSPIKAADVGFYHENGYLVVPGLVSADEVEVLRDDATKVCRGIEYPHQRLPPAAAIESDEEVMARYLCIHQPHKISPVLLESGVKHAGMAAALARLIGPDVKCMQSILFIKPPGFQGQGWHQDEVYIPTRDRSLIGGWIALDDATQENGCLWVLPGSNKGILHEQRSHDNPDEFDGTGESYGFDPSGEIPVEVKAGDVVFFNGYLLHRSFKNRSTAYRRVLVNHYMNAWSLLPWRVAQGEAAAKADFRDIIMVAGSDPYDWKGTENLTDVSVRQCKASAEQRPS